MANRAMHSNNKAGKKGVSFDKFRRKWRAQIKKNGKVKNLGRFETVEAAHAAYVSAATLMHGEFARFN